MELGHKDEVEEGKRRDTPKPEDGLLRGQQRDWAIAPICLLAIAEIVGLREQTHRLHQKDDIFVGCISQ